MARLPGDGRPPPVFTADEREVILRRGTGKANGEIAKELHVGATWVDNRLRAISEKLELRRGRSYAERHNTFTAWAEHLRRTKDPPAEARRTRRPERATLEAGEAEVAPGPALGAGAHSRDLVLNTWFALDAVTGAGPGGLPNDFLTYAPQALLLFDRVLCDEGAFKSEKAFGHWLSTELFARLEKERILQPRPLRQYAQEVWPATDEERSKRDTYRRLVAAEVAAIRAGERPADQLRVLPELRTLNSRILGRVGIKLSGSTVYDWHESYLLSDLPRRGARQKRARDARVWSTPDLVPPVALLPRAAEVGTGSQLARAMALEAQKLFLWMYGAETRKEYQDFRRAGEFTELDRAIDAPRRSRALENLDRLLAARKATEDVRHAVLDTISALRAGALRLDEAQRMLREQSDELQGELEGHFLDQPQGVPLRGVVGAVVGVLAQAVGRVVAPEAPLVALSLDAVGPIHDAFRIAQSARWHRVVRQRTPLAVFVTGVLRATSAA